jgi:hypothetical protein
VKGMRSMLFLYLVLVGTIVYLSARHASAKSENERVTARMQIMDEYLKYSKYQLDKEYKELNSYNFEDIMDFSDIQKAEHYIRLCILEDLLKNKKSKNK